VSLPRVFSVIVAMMIAPGLENPACLNP